MQFQTLLFPLAFVREYTIGTLQRFLVLCIIRIDGLGTLVCSNSESCETVNRFWHLIGLSGLGTGHCKASNYIRHRKWEGEKSVGINLSPEWNPNSDCSARAVEVCVWAIRAIRIGKLGSNGDASPFLQKITDRKSKSQMFTNYGFCLNIFWLV
jgi:hypothetical protein